MTPTLGPDLPAPYHGMHVAAVQAGHEKVRWYAPVPRSDRIRVREHTCDCKATIYELCCSGGLLFVRRTVRGPNGPVTHESERLITARAESLWRGILLGQAR